MNNYLFFICIVGVAIFGCKKTSENDPIPQLSKTPIISIEEISSDSIQQFESIKFFVRYTDGNGDIGDEDADEHSLEIVDNRDSIVHTFHIPPQSPIENISISGTLEVDLENVIIIDRNNSNENAIFKFRLKDRAGNWSDIVDSPAIVIYQ